ncbi:MAG: hypothetical protein MAG715_01280 [Methanonatronarchaeales archaeon]|nr:hypothetical protein [Methanonatronarchaeales archaeon]
MSLEERLDRFVEELMRGEGIKHLSDREQLVREVSEGPCRYCELAEDCELCHSVRVMIREEVSDYLDG